MSDKQLKPGTLIRVTEDTHLELPNGREVRFLKDEILVVTDDQPDLGLPIGGFLADDGECDTFVLYKQDLGDTIEVVPENEL